MFRLSKGRQNMRGRVNDLRGDFFEVAELSSSSPKASGGGSFRSVCHIAPIDDQIVPLNE